MTMVFLGVYLGRPRIMPFVVFGAMALAAYVYVLSPLTGFGRQAALEGERPSTNWELIERYKAYRGASEQVGSPDVQWWWSRLDYSNAQLFALDQYDSDSPGN